MNELKDLISQEVLSPERIKEIKDIIDELKDKIDEGCDLTDHNMARIKMRKSIYSVSSDGSRESPVKATLDFRKSGAPISRESRRESKRNFDDAKIKSKIKKLKAMKNHRLA